MDSSNDFASIESIGSYLRSLDKKHIIIYAHNGTGKTRLSMAFKDIGKDNEKDIQDTLYFNAFTEDLFSWNNDLEHDEVRQLKFNTSSHFFDGLRELEMANRIRPILARYVDFDFEIDHDKGIVTFNRQELIKGKMEKVDNIKISRGEENMFVWCFFLCIAQLAIDEQESYQWVKYIYIDDPISSLDDNNAIAIASHLGQLLKREDNKIKTIISTHHGLFFNAMYNELKGAKKFYLCKNKTENVYKLKDIKDTPFFHHVAILKELKTAADTDKLYTYHFNMLRGLLEKTAAFHGFDKFSDCIKKWDDDPDGVLYSRIINIMSHGNYSLFEPIEMQDENKNYFKRILHDFMKSYPFNEQIFTD